MDDFEPWRAYVRSLLQKRPDLDVVGEAVDGLEAIEKARNLQPDLILLDVGMPRLNGIAAAKQIVEVAPDAKIIIVSVDGAASGADNALSAGASGYLHKTEAASKLLAAIDALFS